MSDHAKWLRQAAEEIAKEGHNGWGNTCSQAADAIEQLEREVSRLRQELGQPLAAERERDAALALLKEAQNALLDYVERLEKQGWKMSHGRSVLARIDAALGAK